MGPSANTLHVVMITPHLLILSFLFLIITCHHEHQERHNRMVPDFQPFKHPAKNVESPSKTLKSGPISDVEWVEEVVPVFGKINKLEKKEKDPQGGSTTLLVGLIVGGIVAAILYKSKVNIKDEKERKSSKN